MVHLSSEGRFCFVLNLCMAEWQTGGVQNNGPTRLWAAQSIASWLARSIILTGQSHNTLTCTSPMSSLLPMNLSLGPISLALPSLILLYLLYSLPGRAKQRTKIHSINLMDEFQKRQKPQLSHNTTFNGLGQQWMQNKDSKDPFLRKEQPNSMFNLMLSWRISKCKQMKASTLFNTLPTSSLFFFLNWNL